MLRIADPDPNNPSAKSFDVFITFTDANKFTATEDVIGNDGNVVGSTTMNFIKKSIGSFPTPNTTGLSASDLYGTWKGTQDWEDGSIVEVTYTLNANTFTRVQSGGKPGQTGTSRGNVTRYEVNGSGITVHGSYTPSQSFPFMERTFTFLNGANKNAVYSDYECEIFVKQSGDSQSPSGETGPGGGKVFMHNSQRYEISVQLTGGADDGTFSWPATAVITAYNNANTGGFNNWVLPSKEVLNSAYQGLFKDGAPLGGTSDGYYWSSTVDENDSSKAWAHSFWNGNQTTFAKMDHKDIRVVRSLN